MLTLCIALLVLAHCQFIATATTKGNRVYKRSAGGFKVEGCFSSFAVSGSPIYMSYRNSNVRCQDTCRDKGYILAATQGYRCHCGNKYPKGKKVEDGECSKRCRSYRACHSPQSCCGGPNAYSVSVVGNINVAKQILRKLVHKWQTESEYRNDLKRLVKFADPESHQANWEDSMDRQGWSLCGQGRYMTGMWRHNYVKGDERIGRIEYAKCFDAPKYLFSRDRHCYDEDVMISFDKRGWSACKSGYYMTGLYRSNGNKLYNIEHFKCCKPKSQIENYAECYILYAWDLFNDKGWTKCRSGYYLAGLYRNSCNELYCLEEFKCCKMGEYNGQSFIERPVFTINVKDTAGHYKQCSMNATDKSPESTTFKCKALPNRKNMMKLDAVSFNVEDKTPLNVGEPKRVPGFRPVICSSHSNNYNCKKTLKAMISTTSSFIIGSGFEMSVSVGSSIKFGAAAFGATTAFSTEVSLSSSFNVERSTDKTTQTSDSTEVSIDVPKNTEIKIDLLRTVEDIAYKWKAVFRLLGKYSVKWSNDFETSEDVTTVLSGSDREMYAFGTWKYPDTDVLRVVIADKYGREKASGCDHPAGKGRECLINNTIKHN